MGATSQSSPRPSSTPQVRQAAEHLSSLQAQHVQTKQLGPSVCISWLLYQIAEGQEEEAEFRMGFRCGNILSRGGKGVLAHASPSGYNLC